jgi:uncharacterized protein (TIGR03435 family)
MIRSLNEILVTLSASPAISLLAKATLILAAGLLSAWLARKSRAAVRHALLASTFSVLLALPIVSLLATPVEIAVPVANTGGNIGPLFDYISAPPPGAPTTARRSVTTSKSGWTPHSLPAIALQILLWTWFLGTAFLVLQIMKGVLQVRSLRHSGLPWRQGQLLAKALAPDMECRADVVLHESLPGPVAFGVLNPLIILPADAQSWEEQDLARALIHELEHVRRNDWAIHCLARLACAIYWFHPLVWIAWRQLTLTAEQSCDDAVLKNSDPTDYAGQLVGLARKRSMFQKSPALAMASRSDLSARVSALLDGSQRRGPVGTLLAAVAFIIVAAIIFTMSPLRMVAAPQEDTRATMRDLPKWDAVSIKRCIDPPASWQRAEANESSNRLVMNCQPLESLAHLAYDMFATGRTRDMWSAQTTRYEGFPDWARSERYRIEAKAEGNPGQLMMLGPMLQALLEDRFQLKVHKETREGKAYILSVDNGGPKMTTPPPDGCTTEDYYYQDDMAWFPVSAPNPCPRSASGQGPNRMLDSWMNMKTLSFLLMKSAGLDAPLINKTNLTGAYHVQLEWVNQTLASATQETDAAAGPSIFTAVRKLGLKIEAGKGPRQFLVFDHAEQPSEN